MDLEFESEPMVVDALGFLTWDDLGANHIGADELEVATVLHFAGGRKPPPDVQARCHVPSFGRRHHFPGSICQSSRGFHARWQRRVRRA